MLAVRSQLSRPTLSHLSLLLPNTQGPRCLSTEACAFARREAMRDPETQDMERLRRSRAKTVTLTGLWPGTTPTDIKELCPNDKARNSLGRIEFIYDRTMQQTGSAVLTFSHLTHALAYATYNSNRPVADRILKTKLLTNDDAAHALIRYYKSWTTEFEVPFDLIDYDPGKLVLLSNLPQYTTEARLEERLGPRYDLRPQGRWRAKKKSQICLKPKALEHGQHHDVILGSVWKMPKANENATTASFIVRCQTPAEAMRLMRRWHNTYFAPASFGIQDTAGRYRVEASILH